MDSVFDSNYECENQLSLFDCGLEQEQIKSGWVENAMNPPVCEE